MTSVASSRASPHSPYDLAAEADDQEEIWAFLPAQQGSSSGSSVGFLASPSTGSLRSWVQVSHTGQLEYAEYAEGGMAPSPPAPSPLYLDSLQAQAPLPASAFGEQVLPFSATSAPADFDASFVTTQGGQTGEFVAPDNFIFTDDLGDLSFLNTFSQNVSLTGLEGLTETLQSSELHIPQSMQADGSGLPWNHAILKDEQLFLRDSFVSPSPSAQHSSPAAPSPGKAASPLPSSLIKQDSQSPKRSAPIAIRRVRGAGARVEKKKAAVSGGSSLASSGSSSSGSGGSGGRFLIVTPESVHAHAGKSNPYECFEAMRPSQRGRKGPLANETKESALQVRRLGACFCCHARKVKCDKERPCKNCMKLCTQYPQAMCWQFPDFLTVLFPDLVRGHFRKEEMAKYMAESIAGFYVNGEERPCEVALFSGARLAATLTIKAKFFTAKTAEVQEHWHLNQGAGGAMDLHAEQSAPIGLDMEGSGHRDELRRKARDYIQQILAEPSYPEQLTDSIRHTELPRKVLRIVYEYSQQTESPLVKKALSIYALHYVMSRHLCLTRQSIINLQGTKLLPQDAPWVTPRVLARQVKAVMDELLQREMQALFDGFAKSLKPKLRREWAPCLAAFLVLCLTMESIETVADIFVGMQNEVDLRRCQPPTYRRDTMLRLNQEIEKMPFQQFLFGFHHVYQTHSRDAATKGFNPLVDDGPIEQGDLDPAAVRMVMLLRSLLEKPDYDELDFLSWGPILPNMEEHTYPRDVSFSYTGRLLARFLLSFLDDKYIFVEDS